jgi:uncharacterized membrane protein SpoIIM required for sporulation
MTEVRLKSYEFRREREDSWRELETLLSRAESGGIQSLTPRELFRLPNLYRATISSLSVARSITLDRNVLLYLEGLAARAYFFVYGARGSFGVGVLRFFSRQFPQAVREARYNILAAAFVMFLGVAVGCLLTLSNMDWFYTFVGEGLAGGRTPTATTEYLREALYDDGGGALETLYLFATYLFTHNSQIGILAFALGFALGVPVILLMFYNGLMIGAFVALYASRGLTIELVAWLTIHGTTELLAVILCGGAGLALGTAFAFPGRHGRLANLAQKGPRAGIIAIGAIVMLLVAGLLEGFGRQLVQDPGLRYVIGGVMLLLWLSYFMMAGRERDHDRRE